MFSVFICSGILRVVPLHGTADANFFDTFPRHLFHAACFAKASHMNTLCSAENISRTGQLLCMRHDQRFGTNKKGTLR